MDKEEESRSSRGARAAGDSHHGKVVKNDRIVGGPCLVNPESMVTGKAFSKKSFLAVLLPSEWFRASTVKLNSVQSVQIRKMLYQNSGMS